MKLSVEQVARVLFDALNDQYAKQTGDAQANWEDTSGVAENGRAILRVAAAAVIKAEDVAK